MKTTQRTYTNAQTGKKYRLYTSYDGSQYHLINEEGNNEEITPFYIAAHTGATIKLNTGRQIFIDSGQFYHLRQGEKVTHRKFIGFSKFHKV